MDIAPKVKAFAQPNTIELLEAKLAQANRNPFVVVSLTGAEDKTATIPPTSVIGNNDINESRIAFKCLCWLSLFAMGSNFFSITALLLFRGLT